MDGRPGSVDELGVLFLVGSGQVWDSGQDVFVRCGKGDGERGLLGERSG